MPNNFAIPPGGGSFDLTVEEDDLSPSFSGITKIQLDKDEFALSQPAAGVVKINSLGVAANDQDARILAFLWR